MIEIQKQRFRLLESKILLNQVEKDYYERIAVQHRLDCCNEDLFEELGLNLQEADKVVGNAVDQRDDVVIGHYIISEYIDMFKQLKELLEQIVVKPKMSRQLVITFPKLHCFQTIQILVRGEEINVVVNMRSCNFKANFLTDAYLGYRCGEAVGRKLKFTNPNIHVIMNIGSLHIFGEEL